MKYIYAETLTRILITSLFIIAHSKKLTNTSIDRRMDKLWYIHTMEYYSTIKRTTATDKTKDESQIHNAEQIKHLTQKNIYHIFFIYHIVLFIWGYACERAQSCQTLCDPTDCTPPGSSVRGDSPGKNTVVSCHALLRGISQARDWTHISCVSCIGRQIPYH